MIVSKYFLKLKVLQSRKPLLGIDLGKTFTGFAISRDLQSTQLYGTHRSFVKSVDDKQLYQHILKFIRKEGIFAIIVGQPTRKNQFIDEFIKQLQACLLNEGHEVYICEEDEDNTTVQAQQIQYKTTQTNIKQITDSIAASLILQRYLNYIHY